MNRGRQVIRQWKLLQLLQASRRGMSVAELHERVEEECVERTIRRDLEQLEAVGFPLVNRKGFWKLLRGDAAGWTIPIDATSVVALVISEELLGSSPLAVHLHELRGRVEAMLTPKALRWCQTLKSRIGVRPPPPVEVDPDVQRAVEQAIAQCRRLRIAYWSPRSGPSERTLEPLMLQHVHGGLYVLACDSRSGELRTFAVQRIRCAELSDETFEPDPNFNPAAIVRNSFGVTDGPVLRVTVDFAPQVRHLLTERTWHHSQQTEEAGDGWLRVHWTLSGLPELARWLAGFGGDARVVAPDVLREELAAIHRSGLAQCTMLEPANHSRLGDR